MKVDRKAYETIFEFEPWDWSDGKAKRVITEIKAAGGKYYAADKTWHVRDKFAAERIVDGLTVPNKVTLDGTEHYGEDFIKQFEDLP
jgi:hypothetical protein